MKLLNRWEYPIEWQDQPAERKGFVFQLAQRIQYQIELTVQFACGGYYQQTVHKPFIRHTMKETISPIFKEVILILPGLNPEAALPHGLKLITVQS